MSITDRKKTTLDDICGVIGFTATSVFAIWFGGGSVLIPTTAKPDHKIAKCIGYEPFKRLVQAFGNETIWLPEDYEAERQMRYRIVCEMVQDGQGENAICAATGLTPQRVRQIRVRLEKAGLLPLVLGG